MTHYDYMVKTRSKTAKASRFVGVMRKDNNWQVVLNGRYIGRYPDEVYAARMYNKRSIETYGNLVPINYIPEDHDDGCRKLGSSAISGSRRNCVCAKEQC